MTQRIPEVQHVIPAEAGIQNAVPALIEKLQAGFLTICICSDRMRQATARLVQKHAGLGV